jgi:hypothetical protein
VASLFKNPKKWFKSAGNKIKQTVKGAGKIVSKTVVPGAVLFKAAGKKIPGMKDSYGAIEDAIQGKSLKKASKKFVKGVKASAPIAASLAGPAVIGATIGSAAAGLDKVTGGFLSKAGNLANNIGDKLGQVKEALGDLSGGDDKQPSMSSSTQQPFAMSDESPATASPEPPQRAGMDPKMLLIAGGALLGIILLTRKR